MSPDHNTTPLDPQVSFIFRDLPPAYSWTSILGNPLWATINILEDPR